MQRMWSTYLDTTSRQEVGFHQLPWEILLTHLWFFPHDKSLLRSDGQQLSVSFFFLPATMQPLNNRHSPHSSQSSRPSSIALSAYSQAASTRHMLADIGAAQPDTPSNLQNINIPTPGLQLANKASGVSLSANYIPHKFSDAMLSGPIRRRKVDLGPNIPKVGGGIEAFRSGEARMPGESDEDYDGVQSGWFGNKDRTTGRRMRWTRFKWILFFSNILVCFFSSMLLLNSQIDS